MVIIRVRETYDLHTVKNKITLIGIHTPDPDIVKKQFPGLLMQNKYYRPLSCNVVVASAQRLPADVRSVGTTAEQVSPEDMFNPILFRACTNDSLSLIEQRLLGYMKAGSTTSASGPSALADNDSVAPSGLNEFDAYYGFLANTHGWRTAHPQRGLMMKGLKPMVYERLYNYAENPAGATTYLADNNIINSDGSFNHVDSQFIRGRPHRLPRVNSTVTVNNQGTNTVPAGGTTYPPQGLIAGFSGVNSFQTEVPYIKCMVACILVPPSRMWELYYRMTVEWTIQLSGLRNLSDITNWTGVAQTGVLTHKIDYDYSASNSKSVMDNDTAMVDTNGSIEKVM